MRDLRWVRWRLPFGQTTNRWHRARPPYRQTLCKRSIDGRVEVEDRPHPLRRCKVCRNRG